MYQENKLFNVALLKVYLMPVNGLNHFFNVYLISIRYLTQWCYLDIINNFVFLPFARNVNLLLTH